MILGIPREIKVGECRVGLPPGCVLHLSQAGHTVLVERGAGLAAGWTDREYRAVGARLVSVADLFRRADLVVKVKEPLAPEYRRLRAGLILFTFLHLAANRRLARELERRKVTSLAYEAVEGPGGTRPLLSPMSEIAGLLAPIIGANFLRKDLGGKGRLLAGVGGESPGHVVVLGAGHVGSHAVRVAHGLGARVTVYDRDAGRLSQVGSLYKDRVSGSDDPQSLAALIRASDLVIGAILSPGRRAPQVVTREMVRTMEPGSVIVDVAVDEGGCVATTRPTSIRRPIFRMYGVLHCGIPNLPALVPRTATEALAKVSLPYLMKIAGSGLDRAMAEDPGLAKGLVGCIQRSALSPRG